MGSENEMIKMTSLHCFYQTCSVISMRNIRAEWEGQRRTLACVHGGGASAKETHPDDMCMELWHLGDVVKHRTTPTTSIAIKYPLLTD